LISDKIVNDSNGRKIVYMLTNQGYDFLFRLREVDEEIQLTIEQLKLKEYIKRKKFSSAVRQSVELITYVRQKKREIDNFILSIRQNIHSVDIDKYEALIKSTYSMLEEEYETMTEIQNMIYQAEERIKEEFKENEAFTERLQKARQEVQEIHHNIGVVITEQRDLIINRRSLTDLYMDTIRKSFEFSFEKRYDFEQVIFPLLKVIPIPWKTILKIVRPLFQPLYKKILSIPRYMSRKLSLRMRRTRMHYLMPVEEIDDNRREGTHSNYQ
jgi:predicted Holliday junction resolvase-like endonuclease